MNRLTCNTDEKEDEGMLPILDPLRQFTIHSVVLRLTLAVIAGGILGLNRAKKGRAAGFRTHMFVCMVPRLPCC